MEEQLDGKLCVHSFILYSTFLLLVRSFVFLLYTLLDQLRAYCVWYVFDFIAWKKGADGALQSKERMRTHIHTYSHARDDSRRQ